MTAVVAQLVQVKAWREAAAADAVRRERARLELAVKAVERQREEVARYRGWRLTREDELFDDICQRLVQVADIEELKQAIFLMREHERLLEDKLRQAEKDRDAVSEALEQARTAHRQAERVVGKYSDMHGILLAEARQEAERSEEVELEDFKTRGPLGDTAADDGDGDDDEEGGDGDADGGG